MKFVNWKRNQWNGRRVLLLVIGTAMLTLGTGFKGCGSVSSAVTVAADIATSSAAILQPTNPEAAEYVTEVGTDLNLIASLMTQGKSATTIAAIQAAADRITAKLPQILNAVHIKSPQLTTEITVAVGIFNAALIVVEKYAPPAAITQSSARIIGGPDIPKSSGKSASDFRTEWNATVAASHPGAKVK